MSLKNDLYKFNNEFIKQDSNESKEDTEHHKFVSDIFYSQK